MAPMFSRPPFHRDGWVYEEKVDGWRMLAYKDGRRVRLISRNGIDHTWRFAELAAAVAKLKTDVVVVDGEVAVFDEKLVSRFLPFQTRVVSLLRWKSETTQLSALASFNELICPQQQRLGNLQA